MDQQKSCSLKLAPRKVAAKTRTCFSVWFISLRHIPHNYVIPQAVPHAILLTHFAFYPHRSICWSCEKSLEIGTRKETTWVRVAGKEWESSSFPPPLAASPLARASSRCACSLRPPQMESFKSPANDLFTFASSVLGFMFCYRISLWQFLLSCVLLSETRDASTLENVDSFNSSTTVEMTDREGKSSLWTKQREGRMEKQNCCSGTRSKAV